MTDRELLKQALDALEMWVENDVIEMLCEEISTHLAQPNPEETLHRQIDFLTKYNDMLQKANVMAFKNERYVLETLISMRESRQPLTDEEELRGGGYSKAQLERLVDKRINAMRLIPLTDKQIEDIRQKIFSAGNPYCPVDNQAMRKVARAIESAHGIK